MHLDMTITLGNVVQIAFSVVAIILAYGKLRERLVRIETQLSPLWTEFERRRMHRG